MNDELFQKFLEEKDLAGSTEKGYKAMVALYTSLNQMSMTQLIEEADSEEEQGIRWKKRTLRSRLMTFRKYLYEQKSQGTARNYLRMVKTIYRYYEIELQDLPTYTSKQINKTYIKSYEDLLTKDQLIAGYHESNNLMKCFILLGSSSGLSKADIIKMTVSDFLEACKEYITDKDSSVKNQVSQVLGSDDPVPTFIGNRQKTGSKYITFASPEYVEHMCQYLLGRDAEIRKKYADADEDDRFELSSQLMPEDKLFDISDEQIMNIFRKINNKLSFGTVGTFVKFRSHQLRAFHASTLLNLKENAFTESEVDALQGRSKDQTHRAYFIESTSKLREKYIQGLDSLMLFKSIHTVSSEKYEQVKSENAEYKDKFEEQEAKIEQIMKLQEELEARMKS